MKPPLTAPSGNPYWRGSLSTVDVLVLTSSDKLLLYWKYNFNLSFLQNKLGGQPYWAFPFSSCSLSTCNRQHCTCLACLCWLDANRNLFLWVDLPKVAKASTVLSSPWCGQKYFKISPMSRTNWLFNSWRWSAYQQDLKL